MVSYVELGIAFIISLVTSFLICYPLKVVAVSLNTMDMPNQRKIQERPIPLLGGLAIALGTFIGLLYLQLFYKYLLTYTIGSIIILITGVLDDKFSLKPIVKLFGQTLAIITLIIAGVSIERLTIPIFGIVEFTPFLSYFTTFFWMVGITNAINLIDGLDGLASGTSTIALISIFIMAVMDSQLIIACLCIVLIGSNIGFLFHNFYPASIYMGDTGSLFLGYSIGVISILGLFKKLTLFGFIVPIILLTFPIFDTLFAVVRRYKDGKKIMQADKKHIHHQLLAAGLGHRKTVLIIFCICGIFALLAIVISKVSIEYSIIIFSIWMLIVYLLAEIVGIIRGGKRPLIDFFRRILRLNNSM